MYSGKATLCYVVSCVSNSNLYAETTQTLEMNKLQHFAYVICGNVLTVYLNGVPNGSRMLDSPVVYNKDKLCIGCDAWQDPLNGSLKHFRWYNFALGYDQVLQDMQSENVIVQAQDTSKTHIAMDYASMLKDESTSDIVLLVENKPIRAHKVILKHRSEYFSILFASGMKEVEEKQVLIDGKYNVFTKVLQFIYSGQLNLEQESAESVFELYQEFNKYLLHDAEQGCFEYMQHHIQKNTQFALQLLVPSHQSGHSKIKQHCIACIANDFASIVANQSFYTVPLDLQQELLAYMVKNSLLPSKGNE